jgi:pyrroline-5-carboxylate reductase
MQTGVGASVLARERPDVPLCDMIGNVCVPGGSTEKGVKSLEGAGLKEAVMTAIDASLKANKSMANSEDISLEDMAGAEVSSKL